MVCVHRHIDGKLVMIFIISLYCTQNKKGCISFYRSDEHLYRVLDECTKRRVHPLATIQRKHKNGTEIKNESVAS